MNTDDQLRLLQHVGATVKHTYRLERLLGAGAMGAVYEARDGAGQRFAVKLMHAEIADNEEAVRRFWREARIGLAVDSRHVVPVVDGGEEGGNLFLVMPLLAGHDLAALLERVGALPPDVAVRLALQACDGLSAAHKEGVVHRDVKPSNLFFSYQPGDEVVLKVCDFGIAKRRDMYDDSSLTRTGASLGSPLYMSPEQINDPKGVNERTDVWSLAATLYELLSGVTPYGDATTMTDLLVRICTRNPPPIQSRAPWVRPELALALHQALHRDVDQRFASMRAFAGALRAVCGPGARVTVDDLQPVSDRTRKQPAPRADVSVVSASEGSVSRGSPDAPPDDPLIDSRLGGRYRVVRVLGRGGMGTVYEAESEDGARVAVKVISPRVAGEGPEGIQRFLREAKASRAIDSPHVVRTIDVGTDERTRLPFIVMEMLKGVDLAFVIKRQQALLPSAIVRVIGQAARGVAVAHASRVIHRDIKPSNIFLSVSPGNPNIAVKVCDFGVAKRFGEEAGDKTTNDLTRTGGILGSPMYMSPEQAQNSKLVDRRTDVWSLGASLFEGLSGRQLWEGRTSLGEIIVAICTARVPLLQDLAPWVDPGLAEVVHRALQRDLGQRYQSAEDFILALEPFAGGTTDVARDDLRAVDLATRSAQAPRFSLAGEGFQATVTASVAGSTQSIIAAPPPARRSRLVVAGAVSLGVGVAAAGVGYRWFTDRGRVDDTLSADKSESAMAKTARFRVEPGDVTATVNEQPTQVVDGALALTGQPGETFTVVISKQGRSRRATVVLARDGTLNPHQLVLESIEPAGAPPLSSSLASVPSRRTTAVPPVAPPLGAKNATSGSNGPSAKVLAEKPSAPQPPLEDRAKPEPKRPPLGTIAPVDSW